MLPFIRRLRKEKHIMQFDDISVMPLPDVTSSSKARRYNPIRRERYDKVIASYNVAIKKVEYYDENGIAYYIKNNKVASKFNPSSAGSVIPLETQLIGLRRRGSNFPWPEEDKPITLYHLTSASIVNAMNLEYTQTYSKRSTALFTVSNLTSQGRTTNTQKYINEWVHKKIGKREWV